MCPPTFVLCTFFLRFKARNEERECSVVRAILSTIPACVVKSNRRRELLRTRCAVFESVYIVVKKKEKKKKKWEEEEEVRSELIHFVHFAHREIIIILFTVVRPSVRAQEVENDLLKLRMKVLPTVLPKYLQTYKKSPQLFVI